VKTRDAALHDQLVTTDFRTGTRGFACVTDPECAVCVKPGTEIAFDAPIQFYNPDSIVTIVSGKYTAAVFGQVNKANKMAHHDCLEFPDGSHILLTRLIPGQSAKILQLPATPKTEAEANDQKRVEYAG